MSVPIEAFDLSEGSTADVAARVFRSIRSRGGDIRTIGAGSLRIKRYSGWCLPGRIAGQQGATVECGLHDEVLLGLPECDLWCTIPRHNKAVLLCLGDVAIHEQRTISRSPECQTNPRSYKTPFSIAGAAASRFSGQLRSKRTQQAHRRRHCSALAVVFCCRRLAANVDL